MKYKQLEGLVLKKLANYIESERIYLELTEEMEARENEEIGKDTLLLSELYKLSADNQRKLGKYELSLQFYEKSKSLGEKIYNSQEHHYFVDIYKNIGLLNKKLSKYTLALSNYATALQILEKVFTKFSLFIF